VICDEGSRLLLLLVAGGGPVCLPRGRCYCCSAHLIKGVLAHPNKPAPVAICNPVPLPASCMPATVAHGHMPSGLLTQQYNASNDSECKAFSRRLQPLGVSYLQRKPAGYGALVPPQIPQSIPTISCRYYVISPSPHGSTDCSALGDSTRDGKAWNCRWSCTNKFFLLELELSE